MRPTFTVDLQDSLELAARKLRENGSPVLPVTQDGYYAGAITESALASALAAGTEITEAVEGLSQGALTAKASITGAEALRLFDNNGSSSLIVLDNVGKVAGIISPSDLYPKRVVPPRPPVVGGMATPFGVYLTTGALRAGVGHIALITTGMTLFGLFLGGHLITLLLTTWLVQQGVSEDAQAIVQGILPFLLLLGGMRAIPLSGIHAAEHKVVHAIERGEELVPAVVRRMPRVHPRCGTNLSVGACLFVSLGSANFLTGDLMPLRLMLAGLLTLIFWRPLGNLVQFYVTTRKPTEKHIAMGIRSGRELLQKYAESSLGGASFFSRIVNSGMLHVIAGSLIAYGFACLVSLAFNLPMP